MVDPFGLPDPVPLGPRSELGLLANDPRVAFTGFSLGLMQLMHPAVSAGVIQHSAFFSDPFDRVYRSVPRIIASITAPDSADRAVSVRDYHRPIKGVDARGERYHALDPEVYWWTHACFVWGFWQVGEHFHHRPLTGERRERFWAESVEWWRRYGMSMRPVPATMDDFLAWFDDYCRTSLHRTEAAERAMTVKSLRVPLLPRPLDAVVGTPGTPLARLMMIGTLPPSVRGLYEVEWSRSDQRAYDNVARAVRTAGRFVPEPLAQGANTLMLKRLGATTQLASA